MSPSPGRILLVEDDESLNELVTSALEFEHYEIHSESSGRGGLLAALTQEFDLLLLDVMLPDLDGFSLASQVRNTGVDTPIIFLTAKDQVHDRVHGLNLGADDYLTKPFSLLELQARVRAVLRRYEPAGPQLTPGEGSIIEIHDLVIDDKAKTVHRGGRLIELAPTEYRLLLVLIGNAGQVLSKQQLLDQVWGQDYRGDITIVESYISYLRKKLTAGNEPDLITTKRGFGYSLAAVDPS